MIALSRYTKKSHSYDESFKKLIRKQSPDWYIKPSDLMKQKLINMAKEGEPRPHYATKQGQSLCSYINKSHSSYDESFNKQIRKLRPDWFAKNVMKQKLIQMAKDGEPRPNFRTKEARALCRYTTKSTSYDESFAEQIRKLRPGWLVKSSDVNKRLLIKMAKNGEPRPKHKTKLGKCLCNYTNKSSAYDESFNKQIRRLRPDWFQK